jgi:hypothetical protein
MQRNGSFLLNAFLLCQFTFLLGFLFIIPKAYEGLLLLMSYALSLPIDLFLSSLGDNIDLWFFYPTS